MEKPKAIIDMLTEITDDLCQNYCKYPAMYNDSEDEEDRLYQNHCKNCPLVVSI